SGVDGRARENTLYFDGLGRRVLDVSGATSLPGSYTATLTQYNPSGTVSRKWLPVPGGAECIDAAVVERLADSFYGSGQYPYTSFGYDFYPLRLLTEKGPGAFWQKTKVSHPQHACAVTGDYLCRKILVDVADGALSVGAPYGAGEIRIDETVDEDGMRTLKFTNSSGKTVLERRIGTDGLVADTRYVYDIRGDLRYTVSPEGCRLLPDSGAVPASVTENYAQSFRYDFRHRLISFRLPGCGWEEYVYDKYGNLLLRADAVQRANSEWTLTLFDSRMRPAVCGTCKFVGKSAQQLRALFADSALTATFAGSSGGRFFQYYADIPPDAYTPYIARYYDNYDFININSGNTGHRHLFEVSSPTVTATGLQTGSAVASSSYSTLYTAYRYDEKGNVVYSEEWDEYLQSHRLSVSSAYDFTGNETIRTEKYEEMAEQTVIDTHTARFTSSYDALGRILSQHLSVDGAAPVLVFSNGYDAIGRLSQQWRGTQVTYGYDIRSHLSGTASDIYTERVHYAVDAGASAGLEQASWPTFRFANRIEESWPERADSLPERSLDWYLYYDGLGRLSGGVSHDSGYSETVDTDLDANVREVRRVFRGAAVQDAVIGYTAGMATDVRDVSSPYYGERVGRFPAGDYTLSYDAAGRLIADGTRGITAIHYNDWSLIPAVITADGLSVNTEVSADGILRSRIVRVPRIETVIKVTADGDTIVKERTRYLIYGYKRYGCFEYQSAPGSTGFRVSTSVGYYDIGEGRQYWYLQNRLGSVMALVDSDGNVHRRSGHYPGGTPFVLDGDDSHVPDPCKPDDRHHIGNHWLSQGGLNWYDNTARMHDPLLCHFTAPDPHARDFTHLSPWSHCAANPANITDPDGKFIDALWDLANVVIGVVSAVDNFSDGNIGDGLIDVGGAVVDLGAAALPGVPGGASSAIKASRIGKAAINGTKASSTTCKAVTRGKKFNSPVHGNSKRNTNAQHIYEIFDAETGKAVKTGISGGKKTKGGKSYRATRQVNKWSKDGRKFDSRIVKEIPAGPEARADALRYESENANRLRLKGELDQKYHKKP
ncbi:MAG: hypothetical protein ACI30N_01300, partial [Muribaculaceae bacterium]